jgi:hypothetical protein
VSESGQSNEPPEADEAAVMLAAARAGWGTTARLGLLLLVRKATLPTATVVLAAVAQAKGWL